MVDIAKLVIVHLPRFSVKTEIFDDIILCNPIFGLLTHFLNYKNGATSNCPHYFISYNSITYLRALDSPKTEGDYDAKTLANGGAVPPASDKSNTSFKNPFSTRNYAIGAKKAKKYTKMFKPIYKEFETDIYIYNVFTIRHILNKPTYLIKKYTDCLVFPHKLIT